MYYVIVLDGPASLNERFVYFAEAQEYIKNLFVDHGVREVVLKYKNVPT